ncbi:hypothetical protein PENTCL1PPCAC_8741, partial [Pristionchus entomophagus]
MFLYDFNQKVGTDQLKAKEIPIKGDSFDQDNFHPHGLTHWVVNGVIRLYVIVHDDEFKHSIQCSTTIPRVPLSSTRRPSSIPLSLGPTL